MRGHPLVMTGALVALAAVAGTVWQRPARSPSPSATRMGRPESGAADVPRAKQRKGIRNSQQTAVPHTRTDDDPWTAAAAWHQPTHPDYSATAGQGGGCAHLPGEPAPDNTAAGTSLLRGHSAPAGQPRTLPGNLDPACPHRAAASKHVAKRGRHAVANAISEPPPRATASPGHPAHSPPARTEPP